jgi:hypothetical protein
VTDSPDEFVSATHAATPQQEEAALEQLGRLFQLIDIWQTSDTNGHGLSVQPGSGLAGDDGESNPYQVSHAVIHGIAGSLDHLHALRMLIQTAASLHTFAPFTLNRAAIEAGAVAVWLLAPKTRDERIHRRLVLATQNACDADAVLKTMGKASPLTDRLNDIRKIAARRPMLHPDRIVSRPPGIGRIIGEAGSAFELGSDAALACWQACSGITHSRQWASMTMLDREELNRVANVINLRLTASFSNVLSVTAIAVAFSIEARRLFALRGEKHHP